VTGGCAGNGRSPIRSGRNDRISSLDWEEDHERERLEQAGSLAQLVSELGADGDEVVVAGDLNTPPDRPELKPLLAVLDDWTTAGSRTGTTVRRTARTIRTWDTANGWRISASTTSWSTTA